VNGIRPQAARPGVDTDYETNHYVYLLYGEKHP
jgi:hypothetical protein